MTWGSSIRARELSPNVSRIGSGLIFILPLMCAYIALNSLYRLLLTRAFPAGEQQFFIRFAKHAYVMGILWHCLCTDLWGKELRPIFPYIS